MLKKALIFAICFSLAFPVNVLLAAPSGGKVVQGKATIDTSGTKTTINQSSNRAIVNWKNFDIAKNESVTHTMPSQNSAALHRVTGGGGASQLAGELKSNGNIFLVNPAGVVIHKGARIDTGGFTATTHDIANEDFMKGNYAFTKPGHPGAAVINQGNITVRDQGFAALVAPTVRNEGVIAARLGKVALASGDAFKLDFYGDDLINFTVPESTVDRLHTTDGMPLGVENTGTIKAEGGVVLLTATQLDGVVSSVVNNGGTVSAASAELKGGRIVFGGEGESVAVTHTGTASASSDKADGGEVRMVADGAVSVSGTVEARGANKGGTIDISGVEKTTLINATVSAEGKESGLIRVGGEFQGGKITADEKMKAAFVDRFQAAALPSTKELFVDAASSLNAGQDGTLIAWSDGYTDLPGQFTAKYLETSGKTVRLPANPKVFGEWLIDPTDIYIGNFQGGTSLDGTYINANWLSSYLAGATDLHALSLSADRDIYIRGHIDGAGKILDFSAGDRVVVENDVNISNVLAFGLLAPNVTIGWRSNISISQGIFLGWIPPPLQMQEGHIYIRPFAQIRSGGMIELSGDRIEIGGDTLLSSKHHLLINGGRYGNSYTHPADIVRIGMKAQIESATLFNDFLEISAKEIWNHGGQVSGNNIFLNGGRQAVDGYSTAAADVIADYFSAADAVVFGRNTHADGSTVYGTFYAEHDLFIASTSLAASGYSDWPDPILKGASVILVGGGIANEIEIGKGYDYGRTPFIITGSYASASPYTSMPRTGLHLYNGTFLFSVDSVQTRNLSWGSAANTRWGEAVLKGEYNRRHIHHVEALYKDDVLVTELPFPTLVVEKLDGTIIKPTNPDEHEDPVTPDLPFPIPPNLTENQLRTTESTLYMYYFLKSYTPGYTVSSASAIPNDYLALIAALAKADIKNASDHEFELIKASSLYSHAAVAMRDALGQSYSMLMSESAFKRMDEEQYMVAFIKAAGEASYTYSGNFNALVKKYATVLTAVKDTNKVQSLLSAIRVLDPDYTYQDGMTPLALQAVYNNLRAQMVSSITGYNGVDHSASTDFALKGAYTEVLSGMLAVVRYYSKNSAWSPASNEQLVQEFGWAKDGMLPFIATWLQIGTNAITGNQLVSLHTQALAAKKAYDDQQNQEQNEREVDKWLAAIAVLKPGYSYQGARTLSAVLQEYKKLRSDMETLLREYNGSNYASASDDVLKRRYDTHASAIERYISDKLGPEAVPSVKNNNYYSAMLSAYRVAWNKEHNQNSVKSDLDIVNNSKNPGDEQGIPGDGQEISGVGDGNGQEGEGNSTSNWESINAGFMTIAGLVEQAIDTFGLSFDSEKSPVSNLGQSLGKQFEIFSMSLLESLLSEKGLLDVLPVGSLLSKEALEEAWSNLFFEELNNLGSLTGAKNLTLKVLTDLAFQSLEGAIIEKFDLRSDRPGLSMWDSFKVELIRYYVHTAMSIGSQAVADFVTTGKLPAWNTIVVGYASATLDQGLKVIDKGKEYAAAANQSADSFIGFLNGYAGMLSTVEAIKETGGGTDSAVYEHLQGIISGYDDPSTGVFGNLDDMSYRLKGLGIGMYNDKNVQESCVRMFKAIGNLKAAHNSGNTELVKIYEYQLTKSAVQSGGQFGRELLDDICKDLGISFTWQTTYPFALPEGTSPPVSGVWLPTSL